MDAYLSIEEIKEHLRIDADDEDALLSHYCIASQQHAEAIMHRPIVGTDEDAICADAADIPEDIKQYILCLVGDMYKYRENRQEKNFYTYFDHLLDRHIKYDN